MMKKTAWFIGGLLAVILIATFVFSGTVTKGTLGKQDIRLWYSGNSAQTFSRTTSQGYTMTLNPLDWVGIDVHQVYSVGTTRTGTIMASAASDVGYSTKREMFLNPGTWTISADMNVGDYTDLIWHFAPGAILSVDTGVTVTFPSPASIVASPNQQIFSGVGTVAFGAVGEISPGWYGFATSASGANNAIYLGSVITGMTAGSTIKIEPGSYTLAGQVTFSKACKLEGYKATFSWASDTTANRGLLVTASNVHIYGLTLDGPQYATEVQTQLGIKAYGADASNYITGLRVSDCTITDWGGYGIYLSFVSDFEIRDNQITNINYGAILGMSSIRGVVTGNNINNVSGTPNAYGIEFTRTEDDSIVTYPRSQDILIDANIVRNVTNWKGIGTHAGKSIVVSNNDVIGCLVGIGIGACDNGSNIPTFAPLECIVDGNRISSTGLTAGAASYGLFFTGAIDVAVNERATGIVNGNTIEDYGDEDAATGCAVYLHTTSNLSFVNNVITRAGRVGIYINAENMDININGNSIIDVWSSANPAIAIRVGTTGNNTGFIGNNIIGVQAYTGGVKTNELDSADGNAILVANATGNLMELGYNYSESRNYLNDNSTTSRTMRGSTSAVTSGTGEDDLSSQIILANKFQLGERIRVTAAGIKTGANDTKTIKFYFGSTAITFHAAANNTNDWRFQAEILATGNTDQLISWMGFDGATVLQGYDAATETLSTGFTMKLTGECANAGDTITQKFLLVEKF